MGHLRSAVIVYDGLPLSSGGAHRIRTQPDALWAKLARFLDACTEPDGPLRVYLNIYRASRAAPTTDAVHREARARFGPAHQRRVGLAVESRWLLDASLLPETLTWLGSQPPLPAIGTRPPVAIAVDSTFRLRDPSTGAALPFQGADVYDAGRLVGAAVPLGLSSLFARLAAAQSTCRLVLSLPFEEVGPPLREYVQTLQRHLPFTLSAKHWSIWKRNRAGTGYYARQINVT